MAAGCLSETNRPPFPDSEAYTGKIYHTGRWPKEGVDFTGKRVAVIGNGVFGHSVYTAHRGGGRAPDSVSANTELRGARVE